MSIVLTNRLVVITLMVQVQKGYIFMGMDGCWCALRTSNPLASTNTTRGEFDSHPFPLIKKNSDSSINLIPRVAVLCLRVLLKGVPLTEPALFDQNDPLDTPLSVRFCVQEINAAVKPGTIQGFTVISGFLDAVSSSLNQSAADIKQLVVNFCPVR